MSKSQDLWVLSGGSGTRLWPFSREKHPKQFFDLSRQGRPLLIQTLDRLTGLGTPKILTTENLRFSTFGLLEKFSASAEILSEPASRNTAAAVLHAASLSFQKDPDAIVGIFPADHFIRNVDAFRSALDTAFNAARKGSVVTMGIQPTYPATAYGYIELGENATPEQPSPVVRFIEKPSVATARELIENRNVVWNAGIFVFPAKLMRDLFKKHQPELWSTYMQYEQDGKALQDVYGKLPSVSVDTGIMEKVADLKCLPIDIGWSDVGSWEEVATLDQNQNRRHEKTFEVKASGNSYRHISRPDKVAAFVGLSDIMVVDTPDAILVIKKGCGQDVKQLVDALRASDVAITRDHVFETRPWGAFEILAEAKNFKTKKITVLPGHKLSYQSHKLREEGWIITRGEAEVTLNEVVHQLKRGDYIHIPVGAKHRVGNNSKNEDLEFIEVQLGSYFGEDDIIRYSDEYQRI